MKPRRGLQLSFGLSLALLVLVAVLTRGLGVQPEVHHRYAENLLRLVELDAQLNEQVAEAHMGFTNHYDDLVRTWDRITANRRALERIPPHVGEQSAGDLGAALDATGALLDTKEELLERFKTERAVQRNAERSFPTALGRLEAAQRDLGATASQGTVALLLEDLLLFALSPSSERVQRARCNLMVLAPEPEDDRAGCAELPEGIPPVRPELAELAGVVRLQGEVYLARQPAVEALVRALMTLPVAEQASLAVSIYEHAVTQAMDRESRALRLMEALGVIVLVLGAALVMERLRDDARALRETGARLAEANEALRAERDREAELARVKSRFVSMTSHEFRTPLAVILSSAELLMAYGEGWPALRRLKHLHRITEAGRSMSRMIDRVLVIGRADAELLEFNPKRVDLSELLPQVVGEVRAGLDVERCIEVSYDGAPGGVVVDPQLLRHVLSNLLGNALKYSPADRPVRLLVRSGAHGHLFEVEDQGIGVPPDELATLFEPFQRCSNAEDLPGTGLGLAVVKRAVDAHGGSIEVESTPLQGTTFRVSLPLLKESA